MFVCHPENDSDELEPVSAHSEGLGTRIYRPQSGASCQIPEMLSVPGEAIYRGDAPFLLNVNHKGVQFLVPFPKFTMTNVVRFLKWFEFPSLQFCRISVHRCFFSIVVD